MLGINAYSDNVSFTRSNKSGDVRTAIWYINDTHGQLSKMDRMKTSSDVFDKNFKRKKSVDALKLSAGDVLSGNNVERNTLWIKFLNMIKLDASAIGNHELDSEEKLFSQLIKKARFPFVASNLTIKDTSPLKKRVDEGKLVKSTVVEKNGHKYGIVGTLPIDLKEICGDFQPLPGLQYSEKLDDAIKEVQNEVDKIIKLNSSGDKKLNKVILTSHLGYKNDLLLAQKVKGIDVIIGGHSHELISGINQGSVEDIDQAVKNKVNVVYSPSGEPVIITQAGKNGLETGQLELIFDKNGVIKPELSKNIITDVNIFSKSQKIENLKDKVLGKPVVISYLDNDCHPDKPYESENPIANLVLDSVRQKSGAQVALFNASTIRGVLDKGDVTTRDIEELFFFPNYFVKIELSEKDLLKALEQGAKTLNYKPELLQVSGIKYVVTPQKTINEASIVADDGSEIKLNTLNPSSDKKFTVACSDFLATGPIGLTALKVSEDAIIDKYKWTELDATIENIKLNYSKTLKLGHDNRIFVEK
ncbi:MAG: bifunctional UDP-sugar hydrolase/5'-nucleotidase [Vampirovibrionia bacterium]